MDWDTQPDPFRRFHGSPLTRLAFPPADNTPPYSAIFLPGLVKAKPFSFETLSAFLFYSLSLTAWPA